MSIELYVYCYGESLAPVEDVQDMLALGGWGTQVVEDAKTLRPVESEFLGTVVILGWEEDSEHTDAAEEAASRGDSAAIAELLPKEGIAAVHVERIDDFSAVPEDLAAFAEEGVAPRYIEAMSEARIAYCLHTSATRNRLSLTLQELLWNAIAIAAYGLAHDPETDEFKDNAL